MMRFWFQTKPEVLTLVCRDLIGILPAPQPAVDISEAGVVVSKYLLDLAADAVVAARGCVGGLI